MSNTILSILLGGGLCALLDGLCVSALYLGKGAKFAPVWQSVASGLLGPGAYRGGWTTASFGLPLHGLIAFTVATVFVLLSQKASVLLRHYILGGMAYVRDCGVVFEILPRLKVGGFLLVLGSRLGYLRWVPDTTGLHHPKMTTG